jgi:hypothetical protein
MAGAMLASFAFPPIEFGAVTEARKWTSTAEGAALSAHFTNGSTSAMAIEAVLRTSNQAVSAAS